MSQRPPTPSPFRPERGIDQSVLEENRALIQAIDRRKLLRGSLSLGALTMLTGCDVTHRDSVQRVLKAVSPYAISKAGILQATRAMALELAGQNIRINALAPGYIDTEMNHAFWSTPAGERLAKRIPQRRVGAESDLDGAILLLASKASRYMTGSVITVDGGFLLN